jgi:N-acetylneuraminic acid mutarotase
VPRRATGSRLRATLLVAVGVVVAGTLSLAESRAGVAGGSWRLLPAAPVAPEEGVVSAWTGRQMLLFGRVTTRAKDGAVLGRRNVAAAYDPASRRWSRLPTPLPSRGFLEESAVWTGKEMLVWGQGSREAFNPQTRRWRQLPGSHLLQIHDGFGLVVWTGREMIGWGGGCCGDAFDDGVAYNPRTDRWRALAHSPLAGSQHPLGVWTGRELFVFVGGLDPDGKPWPARLARAAAYDPATNRWRRIASLPAPRDGADVVWDGHEILVVGGSSGVRPLPAQGFAYDPATNRWRTLPRMESGRVEAASVWTGSQLLVWGGSTTVGGGAPVIPPHGLAYDPASNRWSPLPRAPLLGRLDPAAVWTGRQLILWGGSRPRLPLGSGTRFFADGASFLPVPG